MKYLLFFIAVFLKFSFAGAQSNYYFSKIYGSVLTYDSVPLSNTTVYNISRGEKTITNNKGQFSIMMGRNDTVYFIYPGYISKKMYFVKDITHQVYSILIVLNIDRNLFIKNYILSKNRDDDKYNIFKKPNNGSNLYVLPSIILKEGGSNAPYKPSAFANPISYFYEQFNKQARHRKKLKKIRNYRLQKMAEDTTKALK
ncbi:MAG: hypothetical protein WC223_07255 [Bacteroidales bacterium]